ncbi:MULTISPECIES: winged helix-turn-helix domain-containing protein [Streptomyces rochei group]|uniref:winged helix-turn-helix domain-containing protein n=1 Tax=Streptomyces rochei group TaxID=2867164 RepID=UPI001873C37A|nr:winged helix-turn-helix domain-containing protein [Streptomyces vinaceusdrappus]GHC26925.1 hypothetical protein GCM10010308_49770 [Streptomyces vinaceusdrappus]
MTAMSRATRRVIVAHLTDRGMSPAEIASELGVSRDTVRRDLTETSPPAPAPEPEPAPSVAPGLLVPLRPDFRTDLALLVDAYRAEKPEDVVRFVVHRAARSVRARVRRSADSGLSGSGVRTGQQQHDGPPSGRLSGSSGESGSPVRPLSGTVKGGLRA